MLDMRDSTAHADNAAALHDDIRSDGYVLLRGLISRSVANQVADEMRAILASFGWIAPNDSLGRVKRIPSKDEDAYWDAQTRIIGLEALNALAHDQTVATLMRLLLGESAFVYPMKIPRTAYPLADGGKPVAVHRDNLGGPWVQDMFTTWIALMDIPKELGGLAILRGSHTYVPTDGVEVQNAEELSIRSDDPNWVTTDYCAGDVLIFHCYTIHKGMPNHSDRVRLSVDNRWQTPDHPVHVTMLHPYLYFDAYPRIPNWDELSRSWQSKRWIEYPPDVEVTLTTGRGEDDRVPPSRFFEIHPDVRGGWRPATGEATRYQVVTSGADRKSGKAER
jgi:hypothetical protein